MLASVVGSFLAGIVFALGVVYVIFRLVVRRISDSSSSATAAKQSDDGDGVPQNAREYRASVVKNASSIVFDASSSSLVGLCGYDPRDAETLTSLRQFQPIKEATHCIFARKARIWGSADWNSSAGFEDNVARSLRAFTLFAGSEHGIDGFLFDITYEGAGDTLASHTSNVRMLMNALSEMDPRGDACMRSKSVGKRGWFFTFCGHEFFVTSFAGCYGEDSSRYAQGIKGHSWVLFQPYYSFLVHDVGRETPRSETSWEEPTSVRDKIRARFRNHGQEYFIPEDPRLYPSSLNFVAPLKLTDPFVEWWTGKSEGKR